MKALLSNFFAMGAAVFNWTLERLKLRNTEEMKASARAQTEQEVKDAAAKSVAKGDLEEIRKQASE